jgi:hypothetical protein
LPVGRGSCRRCFLSITHCLQFIEKRLQAFSVDLSGDSFVGFLDDLSANLRVMAGSAQGHPAEDDLLTIFQLAALVAQPG